MLLNSLIALLKMLANEEEKSPEAKEQAELEKLLAYDILGSGYDSLASSVGELLKSHGINDNICSIVELLRMASRDSEAMKKTELSKLMESINVMRPGSWAYKKFKNVDTAPFKAFNTIVSDAVGKLESFDTEELHKMMEYDEIDIPSIGRRKTALFVEVSDSDRSMDVLINMFFSQAMHQLCTYADENAAVARVASF